VKTAHWQLPGDAGQLPDAIAFLQSFWEEAELPVALGFTFELALEEVFLNVALHGADSSRVPSVELELAASDTEVVLVVADDARPFDPLSLATPDTSAALEDRTIGGLGVYLVRQMMDTVSYTYEAGHNRLRMTKHLSQP
jgi:anti-sigma regulatory factor (Ser/Thr protein kinase)